MRPIPVHPHELGEQLKMQNEDFDRDRSAQRPTAVRRRTRDVGRAVLGLLFIALIAVVLIALL